MMLMLLRCRVVLCVGTRGSATGGKRAEEDAFERRELTRSLLLLLLQ